MPLVQTLDSFVCFHICNEVARGRPWFISVFDYMADYKIISDGVAIYIRFNDDAIFVCQKDGTARRTYQFIVMRQFYRVVDHEEQN